MTGATPTVWAQISAGAPGFAAEGQRMEKQLAEQVDQQVAARIRARRIHQGITLQALAGQIGVAFQQAHKYERGLSRISAGRLYHVACALSVPVGFFFTAGDGPSEEVDVIASQAGPTRGTPRADT
jgi:Helix-turn-helix